MWICKGQGGLNLLLSKWGSWRAVTRQESLSLSAINRTGMTALNRRLTTAESNHVGQHTALAEGKQAVQRVREVGQEHPSCMQDPVCLGRSQGIPNSHWLWNITHNNCLKNKLRHTSVHAKSVGNLKQLFMVWSWKSCWVLIHSLSLILCMLPEIQHKKEANT